MESVRSPLASVPPCGRGFSRYRDLRSDVVVGTNANYNSLQASLTKRLSDNRFFGSTYFTLGYTYGKSLDNESGFRDRDSRVPYYKLAAVLRPFG